VLIALALLTPEQRLEVLSEVNLRCGEVSSSRHAYGRVADIG